MCILTTHQNFLQQECTSKNLAGLQCCSHWKHYQVLSNILVRWKNKWQIPVSRPWPERTKILSLHASEAHKNWPRDIWCYFNSLNSLQNILRNIYYTSQPHYSLCKKIFDFKTSTFFSQTLLILVIEDEGLIFLFINSSAH
jgi:hypothetical protein